MEPEQSGKGSVSIVVAVKDTLEKEVAVDAVIGRVVLPAALADVGRLRHRRWSNNTGRLEKSQARPDEQLTVAKRSVQEVLSAEHARGARQVEASQKNPTFALAEQGTR